MAAIIGWVIAGGIAGLVGLVLFVVAIMKRRMGPFWLALGLGVVAVVCGLMAAVQLAGSAIHHVEEAFESRTGAEIYGALFGKPDPCVQVTAHRDQVVPKLDPSIMLRMNTCPAEMARILGQGPFTLQRIAAPMEDLSSPFNLVQLGDTVLAFTWEVQPGRQWRIIHTNLDSTMAVCEDILD